MSKKTFIILVIIASIMGLGCIVFFINKGYQIRTEGKLYIVNKASKNVVVFDLEKGERIADIAIDIEPHEATVLSNQKDIVITNYGNENTIGNTVSVINTETNEIKKIIDLGVSTKPHGITNIPNTNKVIVVTDVGEDLLVLNIKTGIVEKRVATGGQLSHQVVLHPNHKIAYVSNIATNDVSVIDLVKGELIKIVKCGLGTEGIDISPDGNEVWVTNNRDNTISILDTKTLSIVNTLQTEQQPLRLKFTPNGEKCIVANAQRGSIGIYNAKTKTLIKNIQLPGKDNLFERAIYHTPHPVGVLVHPNGKYAFIANSNANRIEVLDLNTLTIVSNIKTGLIPDGMAIIK